MSVVPPSLPAVLTLREAAACAVQLREFVRAGSASQVVLDAAALLRFDSSALAVLLDCRREAMAAGKTLVVAGMAPRLKALATLYGVAELLA